jgi:tetratricopeptide (TPR) repeat protein
VQATSTDSLEPEKGSAIQAVESKELMMVVANDVPSPVRQQPAKRKVLRPEEREKPFLNVLFEHKTLSTMNFDELKEKKDECLKNNDMETAIKYLDRMMHLKTDLNELKSLMLEMAQMLFDKKDYAKASQMFNKFALLYPGSDEVELAMYQAIISNSNLMLDAEHDQSKTIETKELAQAFLERPSFTHYKKEVEIIAKQCDERLLESDIRNSFFI